MADSNFFVRVQESLYIPVLWLFLKEKQPANQKQATTQKKPKQENQGKKPKPTKNQTKPKININ